jgi:hypothetical protein
MKVLSFDVGVKNLAYAVVEGIDNIKEIGLINLNEPETCIKCSKPSIYLNICEAEPIYCCKGHSALFTPNRKIKDKTIEELCTHLVEKFDKEFQNVEYDEVCIENQPSFRAPRMKSIQIMIMTYFIRKNKKCKFQNPCVTSFGLKFKKYIDKKTFSVKLVGALLPFKQMERINLYKKRDDICDAILHGAIYQNKEEITKKLSHIITPVQKKKISPNIIDKKCLKREC